MSERIPPEALESWLQKVSEKLELTASEVPISVILDLAAEVAHSVARPAAPLTTFLAGLAVAKNDSQDLGAVIETISELARVWPAEQDR